MHELSSAISSVDLVMEQAKQASARVVSEGDLDIGVLSGME